MQRPQKVFWSPFTESKPTYKNLYSRSSNMLTEEQRIARRQGIGGSDIGAIIGLIDDSVATVGQFTAVDVYLSKVEEDYKRPENEAMAIGNIIEDFIIMMFERRTGCPVIREKNTRHSKTHPWLLANIDGFLPTENAILEVKNVDPSKEYLWGKEGTDEIPELYLLQCAHYAHVYDVDKVYIGAYFGGARFKIFVYKRNTKLEEYIVTAATRFWHEHILAKVPPAASGLEDYRKLYPEAKNTQPVIADDESIQMINKLLETQEMIKGLSKVESDIRAKVCQLLKDSESLISQQGQTLATWKNQVSNRVDTRALKELYPEVANNIIRQSHTRVLRIK